MVAFIQPGGLVTVSLHQVMSPGSKFAPPNAGNDWMALLKLDGKRCRRAEAGIPEQAFPHLVAHNCPAAFRSAANEASDITSVKGLPLKGTAP